MKYKGLVEVHDGKRVSGWCINNDDLNNATTVSIYANDILLRTMSASIPRADIHKGRKAPKSGFVLPISPELQLLIPKSTQLKILDATGNLLNFYKPEEIVPFGLATDGGEELKHKLASEFYINKWGWLSRRFDGMSPERRAKHAQSMPDIAKYFQERFGLQVFPHYGTLLGYARHKAFLPKDDDVDMSVLLNERTPEDVARTFFEITSQIIADGHYLRITAAGQMVVRLRGHAHYGCGVTASWFSQNGHFRTFFGVGGTEKQYGMTFFRDTMEGVEVSIPHNYEQILEMTYGPNWRVPDPTFQWSIPLHVREEMNLLSSIGRGKIGDYNKPN